MPAPPESITALRAILANGQESRYVDAAEFILTKLAKNKDVEVQLTEIEAIDYILQYIQFLLEKEEYIAAAQLIWGDELFTVQPRSVGMIWNEIRTQSELVIIGAGSLGKSYTAAVWLLLDWLRDPTMTCVKVLSSTETHAKRNVFAHIQNLHRLASVPLPGERKEKSIQVGEDDKQGIHLMTIPQGDDGKGRLRGFHPVPREKEHPVFGKLSRVRAMLDEAEEIPEGAWGEVDNILITKEGVEHIKVIAATNPNDRTSRLGQRCEPVDGWSSISIEEAEIWKSRLGWKVLRLDGARCENVVQRKIIFPGLLTWDGYQRYLALGDTAPEYFTMARGWFPEQGLHVNAIPADFIERCKGMFFFQGSTTYCASVDLAFEGGDRAVMTVGRYGRATGWTPQGSGKKAIMFDKPLDGIQIEQQFELNRTHSLDMADQIMSTCSALKIGAGWLIVDRTGNGTGVHDILVIKMPGKGVSVMGLNFGEAATEVKVLDDDKETAAELYDGVVTELFFATRKFIEFHHLKFSPALKLPVLTRQLTTRRYKPTGKGRVRIESKREYKARGYESPDHADSMTLLVHLIRMRGEFVAAMVPDAPVRESPTSKGGIVDKLDFITFQ